MKFFGKFERDNQNKIYRTRTFLCLDGSSQLVEPNQSNILGTIFMLNPGGSRPRGSDINSPFENYIFNTYTELEPDETMNVFLNTFDKLKNIKKYSNGVIEIKNLFNYRESNLSGEDLKFAIKDITDNLNTFNINASPTFEGDFVFFSWGSSKLKTKEIKEYAKQIFLKSKSKNKNVLYISPNDTDKSEKLLSFYHPLGGHWKSDKRERFNNALYKIFDKLEPITNFE